MSQSTHNLQERDFVLLWNLMPQSAEEARLLVPGLVSLPEQAVQKMVSFLQEKRK